MEQLESLSNRKKKSLPAGKAGAARLTKNSKIIKTIIAAIQEKKGEDIISLDLRKINEAVADFFIICEAESTVKINAIANNIIRRVKEEMNLKPGHSEGGSGAKWILVDYFSTIVHIFYPETRAFYDLEGLWSDGIVSEFADL